MSITTDSAETTTRKAGKTDASAPMNFSLPFIPERPSKPRNEGVTMVMDKGLSLREVEDMLSSSGHLVDFVKLGFGTSYVSRNLEQKLKLYREAGIKVYLGGTLFEAFLVRNMLKDYLKLLDKLKIEVAEVSDGSIVIPHDKKCEIIHALAKDRLVLSEVGSKEEGIIIHPAKWISMMNKELEAGSWKVIAEARESGTVGIYRANGSAHTMLINKILAKVKKEDILWEAPHKSQQVWFIKLLGSNVNLGNIGPDDVIPLETLRLGLRGDTFFTFLPKDMSKEV
jgi:phosphosulfolactate synthase